MQAIQKLSKEELLQIAHASVGKSHPVRRAINAMELHDIIKIGVVAFRWKRQTPKIFCNQIEKKTIKRFQVSRPLNMDGTFGNGWIVERVK